MASFLTEQLRRQGQGKVGSRWFVDETYLKVKGRWCYLYRAIDYDGNLVDSLLRSTRDRAVAQRFFQSALLIANRIPQQVTSDGHDLYPRAIREVLSTEVEHHKLLAEPEQVAHRDLREKIFFLNHKVNLL